MSSIGSRLAGGNNPQFGAGYPQNQQYTPPQQHSGSSYKNYQPNGVISPQQIPHAAQNNSGVIPPTHVSPSHGQGQQLYRPPTQQSYNSGAGYYTPPGHSAAPPPHYGGPHYSTPVQQYSPSTNSPVYPQVPPNTPSYPSQQYGGMTHHQGAQRYGQGGRSYVNQLSNYTQGKIPADFADIAIQKSIEIKDWGLKTYRCTKQMYNEKVGKSSKTVDFQLEQKIEKIKDTKTRYTRLLELASLLQTQLNALKGTHRALAELFSDLSTKQPELEGEFYVNGKVYQAINDQSDTLAKTLCTFTDGLKTLVEKTIQDSLDTITNYEKTRVEFDAYRNQLEELQITPQKNAMSSKMRDIQMKMDRARCEYEKKRQDVLVKLELLDENRVKVIRQQLLLLHSATVSYFNGSHEKVVSTLKVLEQYQADNRHNDATPSFLENDQNELAPPGGRTSGTPTPEHAPPQFDMLGERIVPPTQQNGNGVSIVATNSEPVDSPPPPSQPLVNLIETSDLTSNQPSNTTNDTINSVNIVGTKSDVAPPQEAAVDPVDLINTDENNLQVQFKEATI